PENEIDMSFNIAVFVVLPRRNAWTGIAGTRFSRGVQRVLRAEDTHVTKDRTVAADGKGHSLCAIRSIGILLAEVVFEGNAVRKKVITGNRDGVTVERSAGSTRAFIVDNNDGRRIIRSSDHPDVRLGNLCDFTVNPGFNVNWSSRVRQFIDALLHGRKVARTVGGHRDCRP